MKEAGNRVHPVVETTIANGKGWCQQTDVAREKHTETYFSCRYAGIAGVTHFLAEFKNVPGDRKVIERWIGELSAKFGALSFPQFVSK